MKKSRIKKAMKKNMVWCTNEEYAPGVLPCADINCPFKEDEGRLGKARELKKCQFFQITKPTDKFENSISVLVAKKSSKVIKPETVPEPVPDKPTRRKIAAI
jgi:hypothetical protein